MSVVEAHRAVDAVWRLESARIIAGLARIVRDVGLAEDLAQEALVAALRQWRESGIPPNPGAWLKATAKHQAIDRVRRDERPQRNVDLLGQELRSRQQAAIFGGSPDLDAVADDDFVGADVLRPMFVACHPLLPARARLASVREVVSLIFNEGYTATAGHSSTRPELCYEALRLGRLLAELSPNEPEVHGLVALMEIQSSRMRARLGPAGQPVPLLEQNRGTWDQLLIRRGFAALLRAQSLGQPAGPYVLQAAIA